MLEEYIRNFIGGNVKLSNIKREFIHKSAPCRAAVYKAVCNVITTVPTAFGSFCDDGFTLENGLLEFF